MVVGTQDKDKVASFARKACLRCRRPINKGDRIEKARIDGYNVYVHVGCDINSPPVAGAMPAELDLDEVVEAVLARLGNASSGPIDYRDVAGKVKPLLAGELSSRLGEQLATATGTIARETAECMHSLIEKAKSEMGDRLQSSLGNWKVVLDRHFDTLKGNLTAALEKRIEEVGILRIDLRNPVTGETKPLPKGLYHRAFPKVLQLAGARRNIFLPGPAGCGKSHLGRQVAEVLELPFGMISLSGGVSEAKLVGRSSPNLTTGGETFKWTQFARIYKHGGVFLFDEIDAADANVLVKINSALANGEMEIDNDEEPVLKMHPNFIAIAAANTYGNGADRMYVGRNQLDKSTLDRFKIGIVPMDYDPAVEVQLCPHDGIRGTLSKWRKAIQENRILDIVSTRFMRDAYEMHVAHNWTAEKEIADAFFSGWRADDVKRVRGI